MRLQEYSHDTVRREANRPPQGRSWKSAWTGERSWDHVKIYAEQTHNPVRELDDAGLAVREYHPMIAKESFGC